MFPTVREFIIAVIGVWVVICICVVLYEWGKPPCDL